MNLVRGALLSSVFLTLACASDPSNPPQPTGTFVLTDASGAADTNATVLVEWIGPTRLFLPGDTTYEVGVNLTADPSTPPSDPSLPAVTMGFELRGDELVDFPFAHTFTVGDLTPPTVRVFVGVQNLAHAADSGQVRVALLPDGYLQVDFGLRVPPYRMTGRIRAPHLVP